MSPRKFFVGRAIGFLVVLVIGLGVYAFMNPQIFERFTPDATDSKTSITWRFTEADEVEAVPYTNVAVVINGTSYEAGKFAGSCQEIDASGGVDSKGLLAGELSGAQCWFAGSGDEIGVFAHEDGGFDMMVGELGEGEQGSPLFRGNFTIKNTIPLK